MSEEVEEVSAVEQLVNQITAGELNKAQGSFQSIVQDKLADALEAQRVNVASAIFNTPEGLDDEDDEEEYDITDEEIEDMIDDIIDEDEEILAELEDNIEESDTEE